MKVNKIGKIKKELVLLNNLTNKSPIHQHITKSLNRGYCSIISVSCLMQVLCEWQTHYINLPFGGVNQQWYIHYLKPICYHIIFSRCRSFLSITLCLLLAYLFKVFGVFYQKLLLVQCIYIYIL